MKGSLWWHLLGEEPFDSVFDVGGNVGDFAELARATWPDARVTSFEPLPEIADVQRERAGGRWWVEPVAISDRRGTVTMRRCDNQHTASTLQEPGTARGEHFGIRDKFTIVQVSTAPLDDYLRHADGRLLVKVDVEGHEREVIAGGKGVLSYAEAVIIEVQNDPAIFLGSPPPSWVDARLRLHGLRFAGLADAFLSPGGEVLQYDAIYRRDRATAGEPS